MTYALIENPPLRVGGGGGGVGIGGRMAPGLEWGIQSKCCRDKTVRLMKLACSSDAAQEGRLRCGPIPGSQHVRVEGLLWVVALEDLDLKGWKSDLGKCGWTGPLLPPTLSQDHSGFASEQLLPSVILEIFTLYIFRAI